MQSNISNRNRSDLINLPVVMMVWNYPGLSPFDMERRMVTISERALSTTVNAIEHLESESIRSDQSARGDDGLELSRTLSVRYGAAHGDNQRARALHHGQCNRTSRIGIDQI